jgi:hypothetical protein
VAIVNPFGFEIMSKGYDGDNIESVKELQDLFRVLIDQGLKIVVVPNDQPWGTPEIIKQIVSSMTSEEKKSIAVAPSIKEDPRYLKYFAFYADFLVTVEGGMGHLGYALRKQMVIISRLSLRPKWVPWWFGQNQRIIFTSDVSKQVKHLLDEDAIKGAEPNQELDLEGNGFAKEFSYLPIHGNTIDKTVVSDIVVDRKDDVPGGIDFNLDLLQLEVQGQDFDFQLPGENKEVKDIQIDSGLLPIILNVSPIADLPVVLGVTAESR